jgi:hypothetical protein
MDIVASPHLKNLKRCGKIEDIQAQVVKVCFIFNLEYRFAALLRGMQH